MKALTLYPEHAELFRLGLRTIETRSRRTSYRGRLLLHAGMRDPDSPAARRDPISRAALNAIPHGDGLTRGAIVATAELVDVVPMVQFLSRGPGHEPHPPWTPYDGPQPPMPCLAINSDTSSLTLFRPYRDVTDQLPFGDFAPGRWAWLLDDIKPTSERCPACWGEGCAAPLAYDHWRETGDAVAAAALDPCSTCEGCGRCDPVPATGRQGLWDWTQEVAA